MNTEESRAGTETAFQAYACPLINVALFKYTIHLLMETDDFWTVVVSNIRKGRKKWDWMYRVLRREGADSRTLDNLCKSLFQSVLLFFSKTWVATLRVGWMLGGFHHRVARRMTVNQPQIQLNGIWE